MVKVNLEEFAGGALQEKFDVAMGKVLDNMQDPNTPWKNKRAITVKVTLQQNEDRDDAQVDVSVETKTAPVVPIATRMAIGKNLKTGETFATEYGKQLRGQMSLEECLIPKGDIVIDGKSVDTETGEIKLEKEGKVVDMRASKQA
ncbi:hypothetical protein [Clostridium sp. E02]|uniref:hypothetical protein n=1 Tax=Clostridium sp. E02 TaxID=2487134 RepID=UPI000F521649|nr:hypothetical protein [Clostridium sp. E02]